MFSNKSRNVKIMSAAMLLSVIFISIGVVTSADFLAPLMMSTAPWSYIAMVGVVVAAILIAL